MLRLAPVSAGIGYALYLQAEALEQAYWEGKAAEILAIYGEAVTPEDFGQLAQAIDPGSGESLKYRPSQRGLYDAVVHAPKSVSLLSLFDDRMSEVHRESVLRLTQAMETLSQAKVEGFPRDTENMLLAQYHHYAARPTVKEGTRDVHMHTHLAVINLTYDEHSESWRSLRANQIYKHRHELTEGYRSDMVSRIENMGYGVVDKPDFGFEVAGVSQAMIDQFSQRSKQVQELLATREKTTVQNVGQFDRVGKPVAISYQEYLAQQRERITPVERQELREVVERAAEHRQAPGFRLQDAPASDAGMKHQNWSYGRGLSAG